MDGVDRGQWTALTWLAPKPGGLRSPAVLMSPCGLNPNSHRDLRAGVIAPWLGNPSCDNPFDARKKPYSANRCMSERCVSCTDRIDSKPPETRIVQRQVATRAPTLFQNRNSPSPNSSRRVCSLRFCLKCDPSSQSLESRRSHCNPRIHQPLTLHAGQSNLHLTLNRSTYGFTTRNPMSDLSETLRGRCPCARNALLLDALQNGRPKPMVHRRNRLAGSHMR